MKIDLIKFEEQMALGNITFQTHPSLPLRIFKYSKQAVFTQAWNEVTLICRGLAVDDVGNVVVNCMPKFYNNSQPEAEAVLSRTSNLVYEVFDKMDGSLLQMANWKGQLIITSSGSFDSPQVRKAAEMLKNKYAHYRIKDGFTYVFEIIYKDNRIVLNYGDKEVLTLLAVRDTETGYEVSYDDICEQYPDWDLVERINKTIPQITEELPHDSFINKEGYVVKFANGDRVKYKYDKYVALHKTISGISDKWVHANLRDGLDYRQSAVDIPDELDDWIKETIAKYKQKFHAKMVEVDAVWRETVNHSTIRRDQAMYVLANHKTNAKMVFGLLDSRDISKMIWDILEPKGTAGGNSKWGAGASPDEE